MRIVHLLPAIALAALLATPAAAGHKHRRGCGHVYSRPHGAWISVNVFGRFGGFSFQHYRSDDHHRDPYRDSYYEPRRYDSHHYEPRHNGRYRWKEFKRREKHYKKRYRKSRHRGHYDYGPFCPRY